MAFSTGLLGCSNWKRDYSTDYVTKGLSTVIREMAYDIPFLCFFHIIFRFGGQYGGNTPLLRRRPLPGMVQVVADVRATAIAIFKAGDAQNSQCDILEVQGELCSPADSFRPQFLHSFQRKLTTGRYSNAL